MSNYLPHLPHLSSPARLNLGRNTDIVELTRVVQDWSRDIIRKIDDLNITVQDLVARVNALENP